MADAKRDLIDRLQKDILQREGYKPIIQSRLFMVEGKLQIEGEVIHIVAKRCFNLNNLLRGLTVKPDDELPLLTLARADETTKTYHGSNKGEQEAKKQEQVFYKGRNFR